MTCRRVRLFSIHLRPLLLALVRKPQPTRTTMKPIMASHHSAHHCRHHLMMEDVDWDEFDRGVFSFVVFSKITTNETTRTYDQRINLYTRKQSKTSVRCTNRSTYTESRLFRSHRRAHSSPTRPNSSLRTFSPCPPPAHALAASSSCCNSSFVVSAFFELPELHGIDGPGFR